jgi:hypothetical protein
METNKLISEKKEFVIDSIHFRFSGAKKEILCFNARSIIIGYKFGENLLDKNGDLNEESIKYFLIKFPAYAKLDTYIPTPKTVKRNNTEQDDNDRELGVDLITGKPVYASEYW